MKKTILIATCAVSISAYGLPTYEPFTEYATQVTASGTNSIDLATGGFTAPSGEIWSSLNYSGVGTTGSSKQTAPGLDIQVTNYTAAPFTTTAMASLLPAGFPGANNNITLCAFLPYNTANTNNSIGNSAVLQFAQDITRPASGVKTLFVSYMLDVASKGSEGTGNNGRYCLFLESSNLVEGTGTSGFYTTPELLFNTFSTTSGPKYVSYGVKSGFTPTGDYLFASDSSGGNNGSTQTAGLGDAYGTAAFVVGAYVFTPGGSVKDTNIIWVNPALNTFGGATPPTSSAAAYTMQVALTDVGGFCLEDRVGGGWSGGWGPGYMANLIIGDTWSYVTGGPEFTNQPVGTNGSVGSRISFGGGLATAAAQSVTYTWAHVFNNTTNVLTDGQPNPGGSATVSGSTTTNLTLTGIQNGDTNGYYVQIATASGTGFTLASAPAYVGYDPLITGQPQEYFTTPGGSANFTVTATTAYPSLTYQWQINGVNVHDGSQSDGSMVVGSTTSALTINNAQKSENNDAITCGVTNALGAGEISAPATLITTDPAITVETHPATETANYGGTATFTVSALTTPTNTPMTYAWYDGSTMMTNGATGTGSTVYNATGSTGTNNSLIATLTISNVSEYDNGSYTLVVTNKAGLTATSAVATLFVNDPYITAEPPATVEIAQGTTITIPFAAAGSAPLSPPQYQWYTNGGTALANGGDISGVNTSTLTVTGAQVSDAGTYYATIFGATNSLTGTPVALYVDPPLTGVTVSPANLTQQVGTHFALAATVSGGVGGLVHFFWKYNGTFLSNGVRADGSTILGSATSALIVSNLHMGDAGTYTVIASNAANEVTAQSVVQVSTGLLPYSTNNLVVIRVGDGAEPLSGATGNTLYLDQLTTNGAYVNTIMVPDYGSNAIVVAGAGVEGLQEGYMTLSSNGEYLNFGGFCFNYPYTGGSDVTAGGAANVRGIYALNGSGILALVYTNYGLYSGGNGFRDVYSTDGLTNFWTTGSASGGTVKYVNAGPAGAAYTITSPGQGIPALSSDNHGGVGLGLAGTNLAFTDNETYGDPTTSAGMDLFVGAPMVTTTNSPEILAGGEAHPTDFAFSPDLMTVYVADDDFSVNYSGSTYGGIQRYDYYSGTYNYAYNLTDTTGSGTNGMKGLCVVWPTNITSWGAGVQGAILYATTSEALTNRIIMFNDTEGASSTSVLVAQAAPNTFYHGIRFAPKTVPLGIPTVPPSQTAEVGQAVDMAVSVQGNMLYYKPTPNGSAYNQFDASGTTYQWYRNGTIMPGVTSIDLSFPSVQTSNAGTYTFVVSNSFYGAITSTPPTVLTVNPFAENSELVGWFKLNDGAGTNAIDSSSYHNTGALYNFPANNSEWVPGPGGGDVLDFANVDTNLDNVVLVPDAPQLDFYNNIEFTLAAWIKSATNAQINGAALITKGYGNGGEMFDLDNYNNDLRFFVRSSSGGVSAISSAVSAPVGAWTHVAATFDGYEGTMALYVNGVAVGTLSNAPGSLLLSTNPVSIGNRTSSLTNYYDFPFLGEMQDVRLYNVSLNASDVANIYGTLAYTLTPSQVVSTPAPAFVSAGQFQMGLKGAPNTTFHLWSTTNLALTPVTSTWTLVTTGTFSSGGTATITDTAATSQSKYYVITQP